ncbi:MAG: HEAT repeat domain-containing protein [Bacteroidota bacterium]
MNTRITFLLAFLSLIFSQALADSWKDPSWEDMLEKSDLIALVEYQTEGSNFALASPLKVYKGTLDDDQISISGFSNRYGPTDNMKVGDCYLVFLLNHGPTDPSQKSWEEQIKERPELTPFLMTLQEGRAYSVWTPTAGDYQVVDGEVHMSFLSTTVYSKTEDRVSLSLCEDFLQTLQQENKQAFHQKVLKRLHKTRADAEMASDLSVLHLSGMQRFDPVFEKIATEDKLQSTYALANLLGPMQTEKSRDLLVTMLNTTHSIVQGEVVRQLSQEDPDFIGPILHDQLTDAKDGGQYPQLMNPVRNELEGGKLEIIKVLGEIRYAPAAESLLPLLDTEDSYTFGILIEALQKMGSDGYIPYLQKHLREGNKPLILDISDLIADSNLVSCKPALMDYIANGNKNDGKEFTISRSMGLAHFDDTETRQFLLQEFSRLLAGADTIDSHHLSDWIEEYIDVFADLNMIEARPTIYQALFLWHGFDAHFGIHPELMQMKTALEDSMALASRQALPEEDIEEVEVLVFINNAEEVIQGSKPECDALIQVVLTNPPRRGEFDWDKFKKESSRLKTILCERLALPEEKIIVRQGSYVTAIEDRLGVGFSIMHSPVGHFYDYVKEVAHPQDVQFLRALQANGFAGDDFDKRQLQKAIDAAEQGKK